ncbi:hypothetical protein RUM43_002049 [Polyplax serrata]|uniref:Uncharacterized protein n=1 Tax=Polyplax serrata TaxID=468196 RepID=A0AAN8S4E7_POLSC
MGKVKRLVEACKYVKEIRNQVKPPKGLAITLIIAFPQTERHRSGGKCQKVRTEDASVITHRDGGFIQEKSIWIFGFRNSTIKACRLNYINYRDSSILLVAFVGVFDYFPISWIRTNGGGFEVVQGNEDPFRLLLLAAVANNQDRIQKTEELNQNFQSLRIMVVKLQFKRSQTAEISPSDSSNMEGGPRPKVVFCDLYDPTRLALPEVTPS